jgi:hypothetical protein
VKRRITAEQLQELTPEQQAKLRNMWKLQPGDITLDTKMGLIYTLVEGSNGKAIIEHIESESKDRHLPLLNIGQMIELLELSKPTLHIDKHLPEGIEKRTMYEVFQQGAGTHWGETLCDALWEATKAIL